MYKSGPLLRIFLLLAFVVVEHWIQILSLIYKMFFPSNDSYQNDTKNIDFILFQIKLSKVLNKKVRFLIEKASFFMFLVFSFP